MAKYSYELKKEITVKNTINFVKKYSIEEVSEKYLSINKSWKLCITLK